MIKISFEGCYRTFLKEKYGGLLQPGNVGKNATGGCYYSIRMPQKATATRYLWEEDTVVYCSRTSLGKKVQ